MASKQNSTDPYSLKTQFLGLTVKQLDIVLMFALLVATFIVFFPALSYSYVYWDDDRNFIDNILVNSQSPKTFWSDIVAIFNPANHVIGNYNPLSIASFRLENLIFGMDETSWKWWHLNNVLLHLFVVFLVFKIGRLLGLTSWGALILGFLFALHPMRVESVVWLTERKDVLYASFYFSAIFFYIKAKLNNQPKKYLWFITLLFVLSCLSKIQAVSLPLSFLAIDYLMDDHISWKSVWSKWHYFLISLITGLLGVYTLGLEGSIGSQNVNYNFFERLFIGSYSYMVYLVKFIYPYEMVPLYPYPASFKSIFYLSAIPFIGFVGLTILAYAKKKKALVFGVLFFTFNIMFLLQVVGAGQGFIADRFTYVSYFGLFYTVAYYIQNLNYSKQWTKLLLGALILYFSFLVVKTIKQIPIWENSYSMWTHVIEHYPNTKVSWGNRGNYLRDQGRTKEALYDYGQRLYLDQTDPKPYNSRGKLYFESTNPDTLLLALADYDQAIRLAPKDDEYHVNKASTLARLGRLEEAIETYSFALKLNPNNSNVYFNRSIVYHQAGQFENELKDLEVFLQFNPNHVGMIGNLALVKRRLGRAAEAEADFNRAINLKALPYLLLERAKNYIELGKIELAKRDIEVLQKNNISVPGEVLRYVQ